MAPKSEMAKTQMAKTTFLAKSAAGACIHPPAGIYVRCSRSGISKLEKRASTWSATKTSSRSSSLATSSTTSEVNLIIEESDDEDDGDRGPNDTQPVQRMRRATSKQLTFFSLVVNCSSIRALSTKQLTSFDHHKPWRYFPTLNRTQGFVDSSLKTRRLYQPDVVNGVENEVWWCRRK